MASPLHLKGGFQLTQQTSETSAALRWVRHAPSFISEAGFDPPAGYPLHFREQAPGVTIETVYTQHISLELVGGSLVVIPSGVLPPAYNATRMFLMFG